MDPNRINPREPQLPQPAIAPVQPNNANGQQEHPPQRRRMALPLVSNHTLQQQVYQEAADGRQALPDAAIRAGANNQRGGMAVGEGVPIRDYIVSMQDGMIGSIYFDDYRIRTTHDHGPIIEYADGPNLHRFNINEASAEAEFHSTEEYSSGFIRSLAETEVPDDTSPEDMATKIEEKVLSHFDHWVAVTLNNAIQIGDQLPDWASYIDGPGSVPAFDAPDQPRDQILFEVQHINGGIPPGRHPSRGAAVRMSIPDRDIEALRTAADLLAGLPEHQRNDPDKRNELFFNYLGTNAPRLADMIRRP